MSDEITPILSAVNGRAIANLVPQDEKTFIVDAITGQKIAVIDGFFGGGGKAKIMTTEERTAITPEEGQMIFDSTLGALFVGDGATPGGTAVGGGEDDVPGYRLDSDGEFLNFNPISDIINVTGSTVTLEPDKAYKIVTTNGAVNISANPPPSNKWAYEGHAEIFVGATGYAVFDTSKIVLANQLEPDSVNNCTLRFHDGMCYVSVEDHIAGYIVVSATGTTAGTLPYGITSATQEYIAFDATTNGSTIDLGGSTASAEKHLVGNGYTETILTGAVDCGTSKFTVANLSLQNVAVNGGTMTLGDAFIPSGSTVAVSGGGLAVEKASGNGGVIDLGGKNVIVPSGANVNVSGTTVVNGYIAGSAGGGFQVNSAMFHLSNVTVSGCTATNGGGIVFYGNDSIDCAFVSCAFVGNSSTAQYGQGGGIAIYGKARTFIVRACTFADNKAYVGKGISLAGNSAYADIIDCTFGSGQDLNLNADNTSATLAGSNVIAKVQGAGKLMIASGAILDLTGNTNATTINPGGGITFASGGATVLYSSGAVSGSYMMDNVKLPAGAKLTNTNVVDLGDSNYTHGGVSIASNCSFQLGSGTILTTPEGASIFNFERCSFSKSAVGNYVLYMRNNGTFNIRDCVFNGSRTGILCAGSSSVQVNIGGSNVINRIYEAGGKGDVFISSGAIVDLTGNANAAPIAPGGSVIVDGGCQVITSAGSTVSIAGGTYTKINNDGTTE